MAKLLLNTDGKVLTSNDKVLKAPEVDTSIEDGLIQGTITTYSNDRITQIRAYAFNDFTQLEFVSLLKPSNISGNSFYSCRKLVEILIPSATNISTYVMYNCNSLKKVYIEQTDVICKLTSTNSFTNCYHILGTKNSTYNPNGDKDGYIYVPALRLAEYKVATNWTEYASQIIGHQDFNVGDTLPDYTTSDFTTQTWYSDETLTTVVTSVATAGKYYCRLEA